jgi:hypothetical protein
VGTEEGVDASLADAQPGNLVAVAAQYVAKGGPGVAQGRGGSGLAILQVKNHQLQPA